MTAHVVMYSTGVCPYCTMAERLLTAKGISNIEKIRVDLDPAQRAAMMEKTGRRTAVSYTHLTLPTILLV